MDDATLYTPFAASRLKIERAEKHITDLDTETARLARDAYSVSVSADPQGGDDVLQVSIAEFVPTNFALIVGDALHNLRSALDLAASDVVFVRTGGRSTHTKFPVHPTRDSLVTAIKGGTIKKASAKVAEYIVDVAKPYKGGNDALWALDRLDILDKHRLLLPVLQVTAITGICAEDDRGREFSMLPWAIARQRTAQHECFGYRNLKITNDGEATVDITFEHGLPMQGESVVPALCRLSDMTSGIIQCIERVFAAESAAKGASARKPLRFV